MTETQLLQNRIDACVAVLWDLFQDGALPAAHYDLIMEALEVDDDQAKAAWKRTRGKPR